jgi:hypothetical protein
LVTVVASLPTFPHDIVTTTCDLTGASAGVTVDLVAVIASFVAVDLTVTACLAATIVVAAIAAFSVAVVTTLPRRPVAIAADSDSALAGAGVHIVGVAIVTGFCALNVAVTAYRTSTHHGALIIVEGVAVVTLLIALNGAITTASGAAIDAAVAGIVAAFSVIARFPRLHDAVAAARQRAGVGTAVIVDGVAVIASL